MDPASIVGLLATCLQAATTVNNIVEGTKSANATIHGIWSEVRTLDSVLQAIEVSFHESEEEMVRKSRGREAEYWKTVETILGDCNDTLFNLETLLKEIEESKTTKVLKNLGKYVKLSSKEIEFRLLRREVKGYKGSLQLCLQMIAVCKLIEGDTWNFDTTVRLDELNRNVRSISREVKQAQDALPDSTSANAAVSRSRTVMEKLQRNVQCASEVIAAASTIAGGRSSCGSEIGDPLALVESVGKVNEWLPSAISGSDSGSDLDTNYQTNLVTAGLRYFDQGEYALAESFLRKATEGSEYNNYHTTDNLEIRQKLAQACVKQNKLQDGIKVLTATMREMRSADSDAMSDCHYLCVAHETAVIYHQVLDLDNAEKYAEIASKGRKRLLGKGHPEFQISIQLLADICEAKGDLHHAFHYRSFVEPEIRPPSAPLFVPLLNPPHTPPESPQSQTPPYLAVRPKSAMAGSGFSRQQMSPTMKNWRRPSEPEDLAQMYETSIPMGLVSSLPAYEGSRRYRMSSPKLEAQPVSARTNIEISRGKESRVHDFNAGRLGQSQIGTSDSFGEVAFLSRYLKANAEILEFQLGENRKSVSLLSASNVALEFLGQLCKERGTVIFDRGDKYCRKRENITTCIHLGRKGFASLLKPSGYSPLHFFSELGFRTAVKEILSCLSPEEVDIQDNEGITPLAYACRYSHPLIAESLVRAGASPHHALSNACNVQFDNHSIIHILLPENTVMDIKLLRAVEYTRRFFDNYAYPDNLSAVLSRARIIVNNTDDDGFTVLRKLCMEIKHETGKHCELCHNSSQATTSLIGTLLDLNVNVNKVDSFGLTPLHHACRKGHTVAVTMLLENGATMQDIFWESLEDRYDQNVVNILEKHLAAERASKSGAFAAFGYNYGAIGNLVSNFLK